jgi:hypothetical protein
MKVVQFPAEAAERGLTHQHCVASQAVTQPKIVAQEIQRVLANAAFCKLLLCFYTPKFNNL